MVAIFGFADARASVLLSCSTFLRMAAAANITASAGAPGYKADHHWLCLFYIVEIDPLQFDTTYNGLKL